MSGALHCCPECSVFPPGYTHLAANQQRAFFRQPMLYRGRRSGRFWVMKTTGCWHGPALAESFTTEAEACGPWNEWAAMAARAKIERLQFDAPRADWFLYHLGIGPLPQTRALP